MTTNAICETCGKNFVRLYPSPRIRVCPDCVRAKVPPIQVAVPVVPASVAQARRDRLATNIGVRPSQLLQLGAYLPEQAAAAAAVHGFVKKVTAGETANLLLMGASGLGKSSLLLTAVDALIARGVPVTAISAFTEHDLLVPAEGEFNRARDFLSVWTVRGRPESLDGVRVLLVDEVGRARFPASLSPESARQDILNAAAALGVSLLFATNLTREGITEEFGDAALRSRFWSRFGPDVSVLTGLDRRYRDDT